MTAPEYAIVGRVRRAHGIRGELVVEPLTDAPDAIFASGGRVFAGTVDGDLSGDGQQLTVVRSKPFKGGWIVNFAEITDRTTAERWRERYFLLPMSELSPLGEDEVYVHDLLGMTVQLVSGAPVGEVIATYDLPQGLALEVRRPKGEVLVPFRAEVVTRVDTDARTIIIDPPEGLIE